MVPPSNLRVSSGPPSNLRIVRHHDDRALLSIHLLKKVYHLRARFRVETAGGLVGQNYSRIIGKHASQRHSLLLAHAQFGRFVFEPVTESQTFEQVCGSAFLLRFAESRGKSGT